MAKYYNLSTHLLIEDAGDPAAIRRKLGAVPVVETEADADHAAGTILLAADGNSAALYVQSALSIRAAELLADPDSNLRDDVLRFLGQVQALAHAAVVLPDPLTFRGISAAIRARWTDDLAQASAAGLELRNAWDDIVYHCGNLRDADELFPCLVSAINQ